MQRTRSVPHVPSGHFPGHTLLIGRTVLLLKFAIGVSAEESPSSVRLGGPMHWAETQGTAGGARRSPKACTA